MAAAAAASANCKPSPGLYAQINNLRTNLNMHVSAADAAADAAAV